MKRLCKGTIWGLVAVLVLTVNAWAFGRKTVVKVGINAPITGDIPKVGEGTKYAAQMWLEDINKAGGITVGGKKYPVELVIEDNESKAESAVKANTKMITEDEVLVIVGPQSSKQAVPAGDVANNYETP
ncbi:MAG: ABC transporter substrate-binding protein, partial [Deltaproteobacteria bacterium]|nr:ABC transporter substrate-binding protein [Deltaproteobacteria bacterium]